MNEPLNVRTVRKALRLTQPELARQVGVDVSTVWRWENGFAKPGGPVRALLERLHAEAAEHTGASENSDG